MIHHEVFAAGCLLTNSPVDIRIAVYVSTPKGPSKSVRSSTGAISSWDKPAGSLKNHYNKRPTQAAGGRGGGRGGSRCSLKSGILHAGNRCKRGGEAGISMRSVRRRSAHNSLINRPLHFAVVRLLAILSFPGFAARSGHRVGGRRHKNTAFRG